MAEPSPAEKPFDTALWRGLCGVALWREPFGVITKAELWPTEKPVGGVAWRYFLAWPFDRVLSWPYAQNQGKAIGFPLVFYERVRMLLRW